MRKEYGYTSYCDKTEDYDKWAIICVLNNKNNTDVKKSISFFELRMQKGSKILESIKMSVLYSSELEATISNIVLEKMPINFQVKAVKDGEIIYILIKNNAHYSRVECHFLNGYEEEYVLYWDAPHNILDIFGTPITTSIATQYKEIELPTLLNNWVYNNDYKNYIHYKDGMLSINLNIKGGTVPTQNDAQTIFRLTDIKFSSPFQFYCYSLTNFIPEIIYGRIDVYGNFKFLTATKNDNIHINLNIKIN